MYLPILVAIFLSFKLSYMEVSCAIAIHGFSIMLFKFPLKYILKKVKSIKKIVFIGEITKGIGILCIAISGGNFYLILLGQLINGIGFALTTSIESALLFNLLKFHNSENEYRSIEAKSQALSFVSCFFAGILGSVVGNTSLSITLYISAVFAIASSFIILSFKEYTLSESNNESQETVKEDIRKVSHVLYFYALNRGIIIAIFVYVLPMFLQEVYELNLVFFGIILGLFSLTAFVVGNTIEKISKAFKGLWFAVPLFLVLAIVILSLKSIYVLFFVPILLGFSGITVRPISVNYINSKIKSNRGLIMSRGEQYFGLLNAAFIIIFGTLFTYTSLMVSLYVFLGLVVAGSLLIGVYAKVKVGTSGNVPTNKANVNV